MSQLNFGENNYDANWEEWTGNGGTKCVESYQEIACAKKGTKIEK